MLDPLFAILYFVNMKSKTVSTRLGEDEIQLLDELASRSGLDRAGMTKALLRRGLAELRYDQAVSAYRAGRVTLSRAAEMAAVSEWEFIARLDERHLSLTYDVQELEDDLHGRF